MATQKAHVVIIEWDGQPPPTQWYDRLNKLANLRVRSEKSIAPTLDTDGVWAKRSGGSAIGVIVQEGAIICSSYSLARTIAALARDGLIINKRTGPEHVQPAGVMIARDITIEEFSATEADRNVLARIKTVFGKRGRPTGAPLKFVVSCLEERRSWQAEAYDVVNCPHCGGTHVRIRRGEQVGYKDPGGPAWQAWMRTRFATGEFEFPLDGEDDPPSSPSIVNAPEAEMVGRIVASNLARKLDSMPRSEALDILDALFIARLYWGKERRTDARLRALSEYFRLGGSPVGIVLYESDEFDWLDLAGPLGESVAAQYLHSEKKGVGAGYTVADNGTIEKGRG